MSARLEASLPAQAICGVIETDYFDGLNWKLESAERQTPVWKSSVRKILHANARFRNTSPGDKNIFTFA